MIQKFSSNDQSLCGLRFPRTLKRQKGSQCSGTVEYGDLVTLTWFLMIWLMQTLLQYLKHLNY